MLTMWLRSKQIVAYVLLIFVAQISIASTEVSATSGEQSPIFNCKGNGPCYNVKNVEQKFYGESIGKKIAVRSIYLVPVYDFNKRFLCSTENQCANKLYEAAFIHIELQSIWPEPFLLTAGRITVNADSRNIEGNVGMSGVRTLDSHITGSFEPQDFIFHPGEIKTIALSQGIVLKGILEFFDDEVLKDVVWNYEAPAKIPYVGRVTYFNKFLKSKFGEKAAITIRLYEKDYKPLLTTSVRLAYGANMFVRGDVKKSMYQFKHDAFIAEILYQLQGGLESFESRRNKIDRNAGSIERH